MGPGGSLNSQDLFMLYILIPLFQVKQKVDEQLSRERAAQAMQQQQRHAQSASYGTKRSGSHFLSTSGEPAAKMKHVSTPQQKQYHHNQHQQPMQQQQQSSIVRSNLRQIQCVDNKAPSATSQPARHSQSNQRQYQNIKTLTHNPTPALRTIDTSGGSGFNTQQPTHNGNLRTIPIVGQDDYQQVNSQTSRVRVTNLPINITFGRVSQMTTSCGNVKTIQVDNGVAEIEFTSPSSADHFQRIFHHKMIDMSVISVTKVF